MQILWKRRAILAGGIVFFLCPPFALGLTIGFATGAFSARTLGGGESSANAQHKCCEVVLEKGRVTRIVHSDGLVSTLMYDGEGRVIARTDPDRRFPSRF